MQTPFPFTGSVQSRSAVHPWLSNGLKKKNGARGMPLKHPPLTVLPGPRGPRDGRGTVLSGTRWITSSKPLKDSVSLKVSLFVNVMSQLKELPTVRGPFGLQSLTVLPPCSFWADAGCERTALTRRATATIRVGATRSPDVPFG